MGKIASGIKDHKQSLKRRARNRHVRATVKTFVKSVHEGMKESAAKGAESLDKASSVIARAGSKGVIHKKTASRKIARLAKAVHKAAKPA
ncbi:MAG: 30S ribosomal protein S20 [Syntrophorhabdaceae bacterium]|nr:30S ribosomal protein S20 [Syntrophorhabdaceae bacterium]